MSEKINISYYKSPVGEMILGDYQGQLCLADWRFRKMRTAIDQRLQIGLNADYIENHTDLHENVIAEFESYFTGNLSEFNTPLLVVGTEFQKQVWAALQKVPFGETLSYLELSKSLSNEKAIRAVASANGANAISIIVPCHRIVGTNGDLVGYAGRLASKRLLLQLEKAEAVSQMSLF